MTLFLLYFDVWLTTHHTQDELPQVIYVFINRNALHLKVVTLINKPGLLLQKASNVKQLMTMRIRKYENNLLSKVQFLSQRWLCLIFSYYVFCLWLENKQGIVSCQNKGHAWKKCYRCCRKCKPAVIFCECLQSAKTYNIFFCFKEEEKVLCIFLRTSNFYASNPIEEEQGRH